MRDRIREDVSVVLDRDPAARTVLEVLCCYPGLHALWLHRVAHALWEMRFRLAGRIVSHVSRFLTGVEIHPGADIGRRVVIDHGSGVVIGETASIGDGVHMYHGVTLGGNNPEPVKRHPTVEEGVVLGAHATLIGDITVGEDAKIGAGAVVVKDVPAGATMVGNPARRVDAGDGPSGTEGAQSADDAEPRQFASDPGETARSRGTERPDARPESTDGETPAVADDPAGPPEADESSEEGSAPSGSTGVTGRTDDSRGEYPGRPTTDGGDESPRNRDDEI
jgi:serine O-acetyltransferase